MNTFKSVVLEVGEHKGIKITQETLENFAKTAELPKNLVADFVDMGILNGKLGQLVKLEVAENKVYGVFVVPDWLLEVVDEDRPKFAVSVSKTNCQLASASVVRKSYFED